MAKQKDKKDIPDLVAFFDGLVASFLELEEVKSYLYVIIHQGCVYSHKSLGIRKFIWTSHELPPPATLSNPRFNGLSCSVFSFGVLLA